MSKIIGFLLVFLLISSVSHARSYIALHLLEQSFQVLHVQLIAYPGQSLGVERDVSAHISHEWQGDGEFQIVVVH